MYAAIAIKDNSPLVAKYADESGNLATATNEEKVVCGKFYHLTDVFKGVPVEPDKHTIRFVSFIGASQNDFPPVKEWEDFCRNMVNSDTNQWKEWGEEITALVKDKMPNVKWIGEWNGCAHIHTGVCVGKEKICIEPRADNVDCGVHAYIPNPTRCYYLAPLSDNFFEI